MDSPKYQGNSLAIEGKGYKRPRAPMKRYVQTIKVNKKDENENDSDADGGGGDDDPEITKSYTWDVDRTRDSRTRPFRRRVLCLPLGPSSMPWRAGFKRNDCSDSRDPEKE